MREKKEPSAFAVVPELAESLLLELLSFPEPLWPPPVLLFPESLPLFPELLLPESLLLLPELLLPESLSSEPLSEEPESDESLSPVSLSEEPVSEDPLSEVSLSEESLSLESLFSDDPAFELSFPAFPVFLSESDLSSVLDPVLSLSEEPALSRSGFWKSVFPVLPEEALSLESFLPVLSAPVSASDSLTEVPLPLEPLPEPPPPPDVPPPKVPVPPPGETVPSVPVAAPSSSGVREYSTMYLPGTSISKFPVSSTINSYFSLSYVMSSVRS